jgi:hypothetical protein
MRHHVTIYDRCVRRLAAGAVGPGFAGLPRQTSIAFTERLAAASLSASVGDAYGNARKLIGLFKTGLIKPPRPWRTAERVDWPSSSTWTGSAAGARTRHKATFRLPSSRTPTTVRTAAPRRQPAMYMSIPRTRWGRFAGCPLLIRSIGRYWRIGNLVRRRQIVTLTAVVNGSAY